MRTPLLALAAILTTLVFAVGCGSSTSEPAALAPEKAFVYGEVDLKPDAGQKDALDAIAEKFPGSGGAGERLRTLLDQAANQGDSKFTFKDDVEPWLGDTAGFFASQGAGGSTSDAPAAALIATDDEDAAMDAVKKTADGKSREVEHEGVKYQRYDDDSAATTVDGNLIVGNEEGVKQAIAASKDKGLKDQDRFNDALDAAPEDRVGYFYIDGKRLIDSAPASARSGLKAFGTALREPIVATMGAKDDALEIEALAAGSAFSAVGLSGTEGGEEVRELPGDSWLAAAQPQLGKQINLQIDALAAQLGGRDVIEQQLRQATGLDLDQDVLSWMGNAAIFARGTSLTSLGGGLVVKSSDPAATGKTIDALAKVLREQARGQVNVERLGVPGGGKGFSVSAQGLPQKIHVFLRGDKFIAAYGDEAASEAAQPRETLGDSTEFTRAAGSLGDGYNASFYVAIDPIISIVESTGPLAAAGLQQAKPYLDPLGEITGGNKKQGDKVASKVRITVP